jgi:hypothetical protein
MTYLQMKIAYKYMGPDSRVYFFKDRQIRFSRVSRLNDPFEGVPYIKQDDLRIIEEVLREEDSDKVWRKLAQIDPDIPFNEAVEARESWKSFFRLSQSIGKSNPIQTISRYLGVYSCSSRSDIPLLWGHYGGGARGLCVGIDPDHPGIRAIGVEWLDLSGFYEVAYSTVRPDLKTSSLQSRVMNPFLVKGGDWAYEKEVRLFCEMDLDQANDFKYLALPTEAVREVIFGFRADECVVEEILHLLEEMNVDVRIGIATIAPDSYQMETHFLPPGVSPLGLIRRHDVHSPFDLKREYIRMRDEFYTSSSKRLWRGQIKDPT